MKYQNYIFINIICALGFGGLSFYQFNDTGPDTAWVAAIMAVVHVWIIISCQRPVSAD